MFSNIHNFASNKDIYKIEKLIEKLKCGESGGGGSKKGLVCPLTYFTGIVLSKKKIAVIFCWL
jgi:hypothetical protein